MVTLHDPCFIETCQQTLTHNDLITILREIDTSPIVCMHTSALITWKGFHPPVLCINNNTHRANQATPLEHLPQLKTIFTPHSTPRHQLDSCQH